MWWDNRYGLSRQIKPRLNKAIQIADSHRGSFQNIRGEKTESKLSCSVCFATCIQITQATVLDLCGKVLVGDGEALGWLL